MPSISSPPATAATTAASYGSSSFPFPGSEPGAEVSGGAAISADGQKVVFRTGVATDLPASDSVDVPAGQVLLRDREANTTTLVSALRDQGSGLMTKQPAGGAVGATISADGTTVAWTGENAPAQTRFLGGENPSFERSLLPLAAGSGWTDAARPGA